MRLKTVYYLWNEREVQIIVINHANSTEINRKSVVSLKPTGKMLQLTNTLVLSRSLQLSRVCGSYNMKDFVDFQYV